MHFRKPFLLSRGTKSTCLIWWIKCESFSKKKKKLCLHFFYLPSEWCWSLICCTVSEKVYYIWKWVDRRLNYAFTHHTNMCGTICQLTNLTYSKCHAFPVLQWVMPIRAEISAETTGLHTTNWMAIKGQQKEKNRSEHINPFALCFYLLTWQWRAKKQRKKAQKWKKWAQIRGSREKGQI